MRYKIHVSIEVEGIQQSNERVSGYQGRQRWCLRSLKREKIYAGADACRRKAATKKKIG